MLGLSSSAMMIIAGIGIILLIVGLIKKIKFIIKLGLIVAIIAFIANGGLNMLAASF